MREEIRCGDIPGVQVRRRRTVAIGSCEELWSWLTRSSRQVLWLAEEVEVTGGGPGPIELRRADIVEIATTVSIAEPGRWVFDLERRRAGWQRATRVTMETSRREEGCEISVLHEGFQHLPLSICLPVWEEYRTRWTESLERLARAILALDSG